LEGLAKEIQEALVLGLEIDRDAGDYFRKAHTGQQNGLRFMHYPVAQKSVIDRNSTTWCPTHTDFTTYTMLFQDDKQGLEIEDRLNPGEFVPATTEIEERLYLTIGDFGEIWSNGYLPASRHRVIIPEAEPGTDITPRRYSMPYFINAEHDSIASPQYTGKPGTMPRGKYKTGTVKEHIEFRMAHQY
jgi:isopenicillin N synthase-like dioxygenase